MFVVITSYSIHYTKLYDLAYFNIEVVDADGNLVPNAEVLVDFNIEGKCHLQAVANGNPTDMKSFQKPEVKTFRGKCQLIVRRNNFV